MAKAKPSSLISSSAENPAVAPAAIQITTTAFHHSGPLPDPRTLEYYDRVCPGAAREILDMAKVEQIHRHKGNSRKWFSHILGQIFAFLICMTGLCGGIFLLSAGKSITGLSVFLVSLGSLIAAAIWNKKQNAVPAGSQDSTHASESQGNE